MGTVKDIIREARKGFYDAVILGRRGYALFENLLSSSMSRQILDHPIDFPVWICRQINPDRRHVLLCTDGSEPSLRMADHVGYMLNEDPDHRIILLHVAPHRAAGESEILETAEKMLLEHRLPPERIEKRLAVARNVSEAILAEAKTENCAVVAVGRGGTGGKGWLSGSCSSRLLKELDEGALWVSR
jgi:nucleotide-binding universal stress UspA family protein